MTENVLFLFAQNLGKKWDEPAEQTSIALLIILFDRDFRLNGVLSNKYYF